MAVCLAQLGMSIEIMGIQIVYYFAIGIIMMHSLVGISQLKG